jgi:peptidoglycan/xylan/chitin deacetylase (PgdA/CDA1 family)
LMYHRVLPHDDAARRFEQPGMVVSPETLAMHVSVLREHFDLIHLSDWVECVAAGESLPARACSITFDDGWRDNYTHAFPVLRRAGVPATIFLVSRLVGGRYGFWPTRIARLLCESWGERSRRIPARLQELCRDADVPSEVPQQAARDAADVVLTRLKQRYDDRWMASVASELEGLVGRSSERELVSWDEVGEMKRSGLIRFGSHTCTHARLGSGVDVEAASWEINQSADDLQTRLGVPVRGFCYPNGDCCEQTIVPDGTTLDPIRCCCVVLVCMTT